MRKKVLILLLLASTVSYGEDPAPSKKTYKTGDGAGYSSRDATTLSMMGWGIGLSAVIATLCALIPNNDSSHSHSD